MPTEPLGWAVVALAYLIGSIPFSYLIVRLLRGIDVRSVGSGNAGATNVLRAAGRGPAIAALFLDACKGVAAVLAGRLAGDSPWIIGACATAAVLGHMFPVFLGGRGGKGVATAAGAVGTLQPLSLLALLVVFVLVVTVSRYVSLGSIVAAACFPVALILLPGTPPEARGAYLVNGLIMAALIIFMHRANIKRLLDGRENRFGKRREPT